MNKQNYNKILSEIPADTKWIFITRSLEISSYNILKNIITNEKFLSRFPGINVDDIKIFDFPYIPEQPPYISKYPTSNSYEMRRAYHIIESTNKSTPMIAIDYFDAGVPPAFQRDYLSTFRLLRPNTIFVVSVDSAVTLLSAPDNSVMFTAEQPGDNIKWFRIDNPNVKELLPNTLLTSPLFNCEYITNPRCDRSLIRTDNSWNDLIFHDAISDSLELMANQRLNNGVSDDRMNELFKKYDVTTDDELKERLDVIINAERRIEKDMEELTRNINKQYSVAIIDDGVKEQIKRVIKKLHNDTIDEKTVDKIVDEVNEQYGHAEHDRLLGIYKEQARKIRDANKV